MVGSEGGSQVGGAAYSQSGEAGPRARAAQGAVGRAAAGLGAVRPAQRPRQRGRQQQQQRQQRPQRRGRLPHGRRA